MPFSLEDQKHLNAAQGYFELRMFKDSLAEVEKMSAGSGDRMEVLVIRLGVYQETKQWAALQTAAAKLTALDPAQPQWAISLAYATRRAESIEVARSILVQALHHHPKEALIYFNLACYDCQLGDLPSAVRFLKTALELNPEMRQMALEDSDLEAVHPLLNSDKLFDSAS